MKRFFLSLLALVSVSTLAHAQQAVPEGGLENWATRSGRLVPTGWQTTADLLTAAGLPFPVATTARTTVSHGGTYAAELTNASLFGLGTVPGALLLGTRINPSQTSSYDMPCGVPYTSRPAALEFYYKLTGPQAADDSAFVQVTLTRTSGGQEEVIADASQRLVPAAGYTHVVLPLQYTSGATPDTLRLGIAAASAENPTLTTTLTIDDFTLTGTALATRDVVANAALSVYPSHSPDGRFTIATGNQPGLLCGALHVSDAAGRVVLRQPATTPVPTRSIDLHGQAPGVYVLRLETPSGPLTRKLVVL
jgi:hypothetical protein